MVCVCRVVGTAVTYLRSFYLRASLADVDPRLAGPACLYLAAKAEEAQLQAKLLFHFIKKTTASGDFLVPRQKPSNGSYFKSEVLSASNNT